MCCQETRTLNLPPEVIEALARYRRLLGERAWNWGDEQLPDFFRWARFSLLGPVFEAVAETGDWVSAIRSVVGDDVPPGIVVVRVGEDGMLLRAELGPARPAIADREVAIDVVVDSAVAADLDLIVGRQVPVPPCGAAIETIDLDGADPAFTVARGQDTLNVVKGAFRPSAAELRLLSPHCTRWSVTNSSGGAWFPDRVLSKWDVHHRPFFHGHDVTVRLPKAERPSRRWPYSARAPYDPPRERLSGRLRRGEAKEGLEGARGGGHPRAPPTGLVRGPGRRAGAGSGGQTGRRRARGNGRIGGGRVHGEPGL